MCATVGGNYDSRRVAGGRASSTIERLAAVSQNFLTSPEPVRSRQKVWDTPPTQQRPGTKHRHSNRSGKPRGAHPKTTKTPTGRSTQTRPCTQRCGCMCARARSAHPTQATASENATQRRATHSSTGPLAMADPTRQLRTRAVSKRFARSQLAQGRAKCRAHSRAQQPTTSRPGPRPAQCWALPNGPTSDIRAPCAPAPGTIGTSTGAHRLQKSGFRQKKLPNA